ncbi:hypothetical protein IVB03_02925 [Bradyrhizobium sp. 168]|uniref:hypothetical protein n=1 Tax=Bradyrhizobium sp. 168 TaxID=2782639 RepID=UPI001FF970DA|nr:hypothetical protein [Bradyrhizobium sp. 168]MCK1578561.1 hypothetical protein [Bradyrhizobium sp. 168]
MAESKSGRTLNQINQHSEFLPETDAISIKRLSSSSERSEPAFGGGHVCAAEKLYHRRLIALERADAARCAFEFVIDRLEKYNTNELYKKAFLKGAKLIREEWAHEFTHWLNDSARKLDVD